MDQTRRNPRRLSVFTRMPAPGRAKTRLIPPLAPAQAAALQRAMTEDLLERFGLAFGAAAPGAPVSLELRCDGPLLTGVLDVPADWSVVPQGPGNLGERLARAARAARRDGVGPLVITGSDAPLLPLSLVEAALSLPDDKDAALAPAEDGGYVLIAVALERAPPAAVERLFSGIPWGTGAVWTATAEAARGAGLRFGELSSHWDVDRPEDLTRLRAAIEALRAAERPRRTAAALAAAGF